MPLICCELVPVKWISQELFFSRIERLGDFLDEKQTMTFLTGHKTVLKNMTLFDSKDFKPLLERVARFVNCRDGH